MSLLNIHVRPSHALIAVDTAVADADQKIVGHMCKLHINATHEYLVSGVGVHFFAREFFHIVDLAGVDFDRIAAQMPELLATADAQARATMQGNPMVAGHLDLLDRQTLALVGWSRAREVFAGIYCERGFPHSMGTGGAFDVEEIAWATGHPIEPAWGAPPADADYHEPAMLERMARWQAASGRKAGGPFPVGGGLLMARVTRGKITVSNLGPL